MLKHKRRYSPKRVMRRRLDNTDNTNNDLEIKVRKFKSYNANRRKRRPYQRRNIQHAAAAAYNGNDDVDVFDMEFNRPQITSFPSKATAERQQQQQQRQQQQQQLRKATAERSNNNNNNGDCNQNAGYGHYSNNNNNVRRQQQRRQTATKATTEQTNSSSSRISMAS